MEKHNRFIQTHWLWAFIGLATLIAVTVVFNNLARSYSETLFISSIPEISYRWEQYIPFLPLSIVPYLSLYVFIALSFFIPMTSYAQRQHSIRLILAVPLAYIFFYFYPMAYTMVRPEIHGMNFWYGIFDRLIIFDYSFGQSPSLHIIQLVIVWRIYLTLFGSANKSLWSIWCLLIGLSVLTTYQNHIIDVVAGFGIGVLICYLFPLSSQHTFVWAYKPYFLLAAYYMIPAIFLFITSFFLNFWLAVLVLWCSVSTLFVGLGYLGLGPIVFQKHRYGKFSYAARVVHLPYRIASRLVRYFFFKKVIEPQKITEQLYLGCYGMQDTVNCKVVFDLCSEYEREGCYNRKYVSFPIINQTTPSIDELHSAVMKLDRLLKENGTVFVHCALGMSRSASLAIAWLIFSKQIKNIEDIFIFLKDTDIRSTLSAKHVRLLAHYSQQLHG